MTLLTDAQWQLAAAYYPLACKAAERAVPASLRGDHWIMSLAEDGAITRLWRLAGKYDSSRGIKFGMFARKSLHWAAYDRVKTEVARRNRMARVRMPCGSYECTVTLTPELDNRDLVQRLLRFAGTDRAREIIVRHYVHGERIRDIARSFGCAASNVMKVKDRALGEIRAAFHAGLIG